MAFQPLIACPHCACMHRRLPIEAGAIALCTRCGSPLYRQSGISLRGWLALVSAALIIFIIANCFPIATLATKGLTVNATLVDALALTWRQGHEFVAIMTGLFAFGFPLGQILFLFWALQALLSRRLPDDFHYGLRVLRAISAWSMIPVLLLGILVAIVKLSGMAALTVGPGLWAFGALSVMMTILSRVSAHRLWRYAEDAGLVPASGALLRKGDTPAACLACGYVQPLAHSSGNACMRCRAPLHRRKVDPDARVWAFLIAAAILYIPANVLPVMNVRLPTGVTSHTILGGVVELWRLGSWDLAIIVFVASVVVPMTKLFALAVLMVKRRWQGPLVQRQRTRLYELVEFVGQWSMLDVFVVILLSSMADFPGVSQITAGPGAASFGVVVILTMFAAMSFDPRLGWDEAVKEKVDMQNIPETNLNAEPGHRVPRNNA